MFRYKVIRKCFTHGRLYDPKVPGKDILISDKPEESPHLELIEEENPPAKKPTAPKPATSRKAAAPKPPTFQGKKKTQDVKFEE